MKKLFEYSGLQGRYNKNVFLKVSICCRRSYANEVNYEQDVSTSFRLFHFLYNSMTAEISRTFLSDRRVSQGSRFISLFVIRVYVKISFSTRCTDSEITPNRSDLKPRMKYSITIFSFTNFKL